MDLVQSKPGILLMVEGDPPPGFLLVVALRASDRIRRPKLTGMDIGMAGLTRPPGRKTERSSLLRLGSVPTVAARALQLRMDPAQHESGPLCVIEDLLGEGPETVRSVAAGTVGATGDHHRERGTIELPGVHVGMAGNALAWDAFERLHNVSCFSERSRMAAGTADGEMGSRQRE